MTIPSRGASLKIPAYLNQTFFQPSLEQFFRYVATGHVGDALLNIKDPEIRRALHHFSSTSHMCQPCDAK